MPEDRLRARPGPPPALARCVVGDTLCQIRVLSDAQWQALPEADRPVTAAHVPGLGWVVATPGRIRPDHDA